MVGHVISVGSHVTHSVLVVLPYIVGSSPATVHTSLG